jgi:hypothetical protein
MTKPNLAELPVNTDREAGAELITRFFFPISKRSLERWPLSWRHVNGKAICPTAELLAEAQRRFDAAPTIRGGHRPRPDQPAAQAAA